MPQPAKHDAWSRDRVKRAYLAFGRAYTPVEMAMRRANIAMMQTLFTSWTD